MSCANILGSALNRGTVCSDDLFSAYGVLTVPATATSSNTVTIPFLKTTDVVIWGLQNFSGVNPVSVAQPFGGSAYINPAVAGTATATLQLTSMTAGGAGLVSNWWYFVVAGETS